MPSRLGIVQAYRGVCAATALIRPVCLALVLILFGMGAIVVAHEKEGFVVLPDSAPRFSGPQGGEANITEILATREQTGGSFGAWRYTSVPGGGPPLHIHRAEDEFFYVLKGEFAFQLGDCIKHAPAGSFVFIPKDVVHTFQTISSEPGVLLGSVHPGGFEGLFQDLPGADEETDKALFKKHNMDVVGPPLDEARSPARLAAGHGGTAVAQSPTKA
jgi:quercetin dioxygenase-like cupin family protein